MENNIEPREMTQEELDMIVGGNIPNQPQMQQQQSVPGIRCPNCSNMIPISIQQILYSKCLFCPTCGLKLNIDKRKAEYAQKILAKVDEAQRRVEEESHFTD